MHRIEKVIFFEINFSFVGQQASHAAFTEYNLFRCSGCVTERVLNGCGQKPLAPLSPRPRPTRIETMNFTLAFAAHSAGSSRQRARCVKTGRFVAWAAAPKALRVSVYGVLVAPVAPVAVVEFSSPPPAPVVAQVVAQVVVDAPGAILSPPSPPVVAHVGAVSVVSAAVKAVALVVGRWFRRAVKALATVAVVGSLVALGPLDQARIVETPSAKAAPW